MPGLHAQEPHDRSSMAGGLGPRAARGAAVSRARVEPEHVDRPGARADPAQPVAHGLRRRSPARSAPPRAASSPSASCAASVAACVQPEPCAAPSGWRVPGIAVSCSPSYSRSVASSRCPPVRTTTCGPSAWIARTSVLAARRPRRALRARAPRGRSASPRSRAAGAARAARPRRRRRAARAAGLGDHHRVERRRASRAAGGRAPRATAAVLCADPSIPIFTASTPMSSTTARTCSTIIVRADRLDARDRDGVLGGDRRDRRRPVHAAAGEGLQVGLDAGAAAGVRAGDREAHGDGAGGGHRAPRIGRGRRRHRITRA